MISRRGWVFYSVYVSRRSLDNPKGFYASRPMGFANNIGSIVCSYILLADKIRVDVTDRHLVNFPTNYPNKGSLVWGVSKPAPSYGKKQGWKPKLFILLSAQPHRTIGVP